MLKKILSVIMCAALCAFVPSCGREKPDVGEKKIKIVGTVFPPYDFAREVGGKYADVEMLMPPGSDSHSYSGDNPADILKIKNADIFIYVGGESESKWVGDILSRIERSEGKIPLTVSLIDVCDTLFEDENGIFETESGKSEADEHVWTSLRNSEMAAAAVRDAVCSVDSSHAEYYKERADSYIEKLRRLDADFKKLFENSENKTFVFADRFPFRYFANDYSLECFAAFNGCASESEPSPTTIVKLCGIVKEKNLKNIFYIETSKSGVPSVVSKATGAAPLLLFSCHTVSEKQLKDGVTYLSLMKENYETFKEAVKND